MLHMLFCKIIPFLLFREPGNAWALQKAKENLMNHYLVVGVTERLTEFVALMEVLLPRFFKGATKKFVIGRHILHLLLSYEGP